jgi:hypothetical protein
MEDDTAAALRELVQLADTMPGQFRPEFDLGYRSGVSDDAESWYVRFEGDIEGTEFTVLGFTAAQALRKASEEALRRRAAVER